MDSTLLAALAHEALPPSIPIDLACVCFDGGRSPDRQSALDALQELRSFAPTRQWRFIQARVHALGRGWPFCALLFCSGGSAASPAALLVEKAWPQPASFLRENLLLLLPLVPAAGGLLPG